MSSLNSPSASSNNDLSSLSLPTWFLALFALGYLMKMAAGLFVWIFCAVFLFALLDPLHERLQKRGISSAFSSFLLILMTCVGAILTMYLFFYFSADVINELEESKKILIDQFDQLQISISSLFNNLSPFSGAAQAKDLLTGKSIPKVEVIQTSPLGGAVGTTIVTGFGSAMTVLTYFVLCPILALFMMIEKEILAKTFSQVFETPEKARQTWKDIVGVVQSFFLGNLFLFLVTIPLFAITFKIFDLQSAITLSLLASLMNVIPFVGAILTGILPALAVLSQTQSASKAIWLYLICAFIHFIVANFVTPKILGSRLSLNATVSTISLFVWGLLWGAMGLLLAIPLTASLKVLLRSSSRPALRWMADLFEKPVFVKPSLRKPVFPKSLFRK